MIVTIWHDEPPREREIHRVYKGVDRVSHFRDGGINLYLEKTLLASFGPNTKWSVEAAEEHDAP